MSQGQGRSVLTEQTVLAFAAVPPSAVCSPVLPACVCEERGGETRFAMNQKTQLQFNLGIAPNNANLATNFDPTRPSPVVIEKMRTGIRHASETIGMSNTPIGDFKAVLPERLALAMKLAKRNARCKSPQASSDERGSPVYHNHANERRPPLSHHDHIESSNKVSERRANGGASIYHEDVPPTDNAQTNFPRPRAKLAFKVPPTPPESIAREIARLKTDLDRQLAKLNRAKGEIGGRKKPHVQTVSKTVYWDEVDENEDRQQQRREEQMSRNARMVYDLSQQVKTIQKKQEPRNSQSVTVQKLAAAQRAALRTLQGYSRPGKWPNPIPPELSLLVHQLGLLSSRLGGDANTELDTNLQELMGVQQELTMSVQAQEEATVKAYHHPSINLQDKKAAFTKKMQSKKKKSFRIGGVIYSSPHLQHLGQQYCTHFSNRTFNSARRQQPLQPYTSPHAQHRSTNQVEPQFCHQLVMTHQPSPKRKLILKNAQSSSRNRIKSPAAPPCSPKLKKKKKVSHLRKKKKGNKVVLEDQEKECSDTPYILSPPLSDETPEPPDVSSAIAMQANQLQLLREEISQKLAELKGGTERNLQLRATIPPRAMSDTQSVRFADPQMPRIAELNSDTARRKAGSNLQLHATIRMSSMLRRLEELEAEEEVIRQRWNTIVYEDPLTTRPPTTRPLSPAQPLEKGASVPLLSSESLSSIEQYRQQYNRYLNTTGLSTQGGFNPWKMAESIADELLDEVLEGVADEVGQLCDNCVEELYGNEFIRPP